MGIVWFLDSAAQMLNYSHFEMDCMSFSFVREVLGVSAGQRALIANGMVVGPFDEEEEIIDSDVELLEKIVDIQGAAVRVFIPHFLYCPVYLVTFKVVQTCF